MIATVVRKLLASVAPWAITALLGVILGLIIGAKVFSDEPASSDVKALTIEIDRSIEDAAKAEIKLEEKREQVRTEIKYITKEIVKYVPATETAGDCQLNVGAVGLLNAARTGTDFQPAAYLDAQIQAASGVGLRELSLADIELARQYRELAADHDALVEYVEDYRQRLKQHHSQ